MVKFKPLKVTLLHEHFYVFMFYKTVNIILNYVKKLQNQYLSQAFLHLKKPWSRSMMWHTRGHLWPQISSNSHMSKHPPSGTAEKSLTDEARVTWSGCCSQRRTKWRPVHNQHSIVQADYIFKAFWQDTVNTVHNYTELLIVKKNENRILLGIRCCCIGGTQDITNELCRCLRFGKYEDWSQFHIKKNP